MSLTPELQRIYSSAPNNTRFYEGLVLTHSAWTDPIAIMTNTVVPMTKVLNGENIEFQPAAFAITLPKRDDFGLVELAVSFPLVSRGMVELIERAERAQKSILAKLTVYIDASPDPQMTPIELQLNKIAMNETEVTGVAARIDLLNKVFPRRIVRPESFPGLYRT
jgi:hypothetical protein